jgi:hypothetical protein
MRRQPAVSIVVLDRIARAQQTITMTRTATGKPRSADEAATVVPGGPGEQAGEELRCQWSRSVFVLGIAGDWLVVMPLSEARRLAALEEALWESRTWGAFRSRIADDPQTLAELRERFDGHLPDPAGPFHADDIPGHADGSWPSWPAQAMLDWLPRSVQALGTIEESVFNGPLLRLDEAVRGEVLDAMAAEGIECREDSRGLVARACGY